MNPDRELARLSSKINARLQWTTDIALYFWKLRVDISLFKTLNQ